MLTKFESKSHRVKGLSFHPKRSWILAALHDGVIQLWDYRMGVLLDKFEEHEGPVRGIDFHKTQPLFVSGGDDYKVKVWNYKLRRCLFTLTGHLDYIRTVQFHHEAPWIVSASDDQTIRIWNWQSRTCLSVLTGHNHYIMSASFHPREDLIVSASLDMTVRVWDTSGLRRKNVRGSAGDDHGAMGMRMQSEMFGVGDAVVKYVLEGHDRGINWAAFHPTQNLIISAADDRQIKLWRMSETRAWEVDTFRGHVNNVSCALFHPKNDLVISDSEDRSIRVWDAQKRVCLQTFRRESDRFWTLTVHPTQNLIAAGHDSGMIVFKLERERPPYAVLGNQVFYVRERYLRRNVVGTGADVPLLSLRSRRTVGPAGNGDLRTLLINPHTPDDTYVMLLSGGSDMSYEILHLTSGTEEELIRGSCISAAFTARNKVAVLERSPRQIVVRGYGAEEGKRVRPPYPNADYMFPAATMGRVLVRAEDRIGLFELSSHRLIAELTSVNVKYVVWSADGSHVALLGKHSVVLADRDLTQICSVNETVRVKSGCWDEHGVFIYTTLNHIKYLLPLPSGEHGIVRTLDNPVYTVECRGNNLFVLDRDAKMKPIAVDTTEYQFKLALARHQPEKVIGIIKTSQLCGHAVIAYLQKAGFPEIALFFVEDEETRFNLALECGNLEIALKAAKALHNADTWLRLAEIAMLHGAVDIVEVAYRAVESFERLSFLSLITGNTDKLNKLAQVSIARADVQSRFHNALYLGNVEERVKCLEGAGQIALAYTTAATYGLEVEAARLHACLVDAGLPVPAIASDAVALLPATPILRNAGNWPVLPIARDAFDPATIAAVAAAAVDSASAANTGEGAGAGVAASAAAAAVAAAVSIAQPVAPAAARPRDAFDDEDMEGESSAGAGWGMDDDLGLEPLDAGVGGGAAAAAEEGAAEVGGGWDMDDLDDLGPVQAASAATSGKGVGASGWAPPKGGTSVPSYWAANSAVAGDHVAAGSFEAAMSLLQRQIGLVNFEPLKPYFMQTFLGARLSLPVLPEMAALPVYLQRADADTAPMKEATLPTSTVTLAMVQERVRALYKSFTEGKFSESLAHCDAVFAMVPLVVVSSKTLAADVKALLRVATEYKLVLRIVTTAKSHDQADAVRQVELGAYMTHCQLELPHHMLVMNMAMAIAFKFKNFITAASIARRLLEIPDINSAKNATLQQKAKQVLQRSEAEARNANKINYDERTPFQICANTLTPIYRGSPAVFSPYSGAAYQPQFAGSVCVLDGMAEIGLETLGLVSTSSTA